MGGLKSQCTWVLYLQELGTDQIPNLPWVRRRLHPHGCTPISDQTHPDSLLVAGEEEITITGKLFHAKT